MVCQRALEPASKLQATRWVGRDVVIDGVVGVSDDELYRAMDFLLECSERVQESVFFSVASLLNLEVDVIFFDTTSTYWETEPSEQTPEEEDDGQHAGEAGGDEGPLRRLGHSKDHRPDLPQVVIGLAVTREGVPVRCWVWPGNTNDQTVVKEVKDDLNGWRLGRAIYVVDSGFSGQENLRHLRSGGGHYIAGIKLRSGMADTEAALSRQGRYRTVKDNLRVKEVKIGDGDAAERYVLCHNPVEADRDCARREQAIERIETELDRLAAQRERGRPRPSATLTSAASARCAITRRSPNICARPRPVGSCSTARRSKARSAWTASTCSEPQTPASAPRTSPSATLILQ